MIKTIQQSNISILFEACTGHEPKRLASVTGNLSNATNLSPFTNLHPVFSRWNVDFPVEYSTSKSFDTSNCQTRQHVFFLAPCPYHLLSIFQKKGSQTEFKSASFLLLNFWEHAKVCDFVAQLPLSSFSTLKVSKRLPRNWSFLCCSLPTVFFVFFFLLLRWLPTDSAQKKFSPLSKFFFSSFLSRVRVYAEFYPCMHECPQWFCVAQLYTSAFACGAWFRFGAASTRRFQHFFTL